MAVAMLEAQMVFMATVEAATADRAMELEPTAVIAVEDAATAVIAV